MNIPKVENFTIRGLRILGSSDRRTPFSVDLTILESTVTGINGYRAIDAKGFGKDLKGPHRITLLTEKTSVIGIYALEGQGSVLKLKGGGPFKIDFIKPVTKLYFKGKPEVKDGKTYMEVVDFKVDIAIKSFDMKFDKIFKDKALTDNANFFLNEYGQEFYGDFKDILNKEMSKIFKKIVADVMEFVPYEDLFLKDDEDEELKSVTDAVES